MRAVDDYCKDYYENIRIDSHADILVQGNRSALRKEMNLCSAVSFSEKSMRSNNWYTDWAWQCIMMALLRNWGPKRRKNLEIRYYQGQYSDSVKYGILREEWSTRV